MRPDIVPGAVFPDYELSDHRGKHRTLSELQGGDPLVLVLSRGGFCPKDRRQHEGLLQLHREMQVGYCRLVTISTDNLLETNEFRAGVGAHWTFLSDPGRRVQKDLDIAEYTDPHHNPMVGHSWAGVVITEAGIDPKVAGLVYVAAFGPDQGEVVGDLGKAYPPPPAFTAPIVDAQGFMTLPTDAVLKHFAQDLPPAEARVVAATQGPVSVSAFGSKVSNVAWKTKPSWYIVSAQDGAIAPDEERFFAKRMKATTTELKASHVSMLSQPQAVAAVILDAVAKAQSAGRPGAH